MTTHLRALRWPSAVAIAALLLTSGNLTAHADDIANALDDTIDSTAEVIALTAGGANGTTTLYVEPTNGDGKNGCNLTGSTTLTLSVTSSNTSVATVAPASVTFTSCGDTKQITVTPVAVGTAVVTLTQTSNSTGGTFDLAPGTFDVNVAAPTPSNTPPKLDITGVTAGSSYEIGSVPAALCEVTDAEDGPSTFPATLSAVSGDLAAYGLGTRTAACTYTDHGGLEVSSSLTYAIVDTTDPTITFVSRTAANGNGWNNDDVTLTWSCTDLVGVKDASVTATLTDEGADQSATGTCTDVAGNTASDTQTGINIDKTLPVLTSTRTPAANTYGWNNEDVTVQWTCTDAESGPQVAGESQTTSTEAAGLSLEWTCTDLAGNSVTSTVDGINVDKTVPTISALVTPDRPSSGWWNATGGAPKVTYTCADTLSQVATCTDPKIFGEGENQSDTGTAFDKAGNSTSIEVDAISVDLTAPGITWTGGPTAGASYYFGQVPAAGTCTATDALSGAKDCAITGYATTVGAHTLTATAHDKAGNETLVTRDFTVLAWTLGGFYQPVDMGGVWNTVKNGSTVPLKFEVFAGATELTDTAVVDTFTVKGIACPVSGAITDDIELVTTGGTSLRYDTTAGQFVQNWQTPKKPGACYQVTMTTDDGSAISANVKLK